jgi:DNA-binding LacI/PurR family transcriptional regulator
MLPNMHSLAQEFGTSYFTVQTAISALEKEGIVESSKRHGTIVRYNANALTCAGIYCGNGLMDDHQFDFYRELLKQLRAQLAGSNVRAEIFLDSRTADEHTRPLPVLARAVERNEVQGLIVALADGRCEPWLRQLPIAKSFAGSDPALNPVGPDVDQMLRLALTRLRERGCRTVGMISAMHIPATILKLDPFRNSGRQLRATRRDSMDPYFWMYVSYADLVADLGLKTGAPWLFAPSDPAPNHERHGYAAFHELWRRPDRPDGLLVYTDTAARGVMTAALELGVRVPEDIKMVFHHNTGVDWTCPLGVDWVENDVGAWAAAMIEQVRRQKAGEEIQEPTVLGYRLVEG